MGLGSCKMEDDGREGGGIGDSNALDFATYEDYLDSQISPIDLFYLEDEDLARQLVELGFQHSIPVQRS